METKKCEFFATKVEYLGTFISADGYTPLTKCQEIVSKCTVPQNQSQLKSVLRMVTFVAKHIPNLNLRLQTFHELLDTQ